MKTTQKFGLLMTGLVLVIVTLFSGMHCEKDFPPGTPEIDKLPPTTQTGADTFGCLVDGVALTPKGSPFGGPILQCQYQYVQPNNKPAGLYFVLSASDSKSYADGIHGIQISGDNVSLEEMTYLLTEQNTDQKFAGTFYIIKEGPNNEYDTNSIQTGELTITRFDDFNQIVSGTFWFDAINPDGKKVEVREGRFDMHFIK